MRGLPTVHGVRREPLRLALVTLALTVELLSSRLCAQNLVVNGGFHSDVAGWDGDSGTLLWTDITEEGDCPGSGAALIASEPAAGQHYATISQCVSVVGLSSLSIHVRHQGYGTFTTVLQFFQGDICNAGALQNVSVGVSQTPTVWQTHGFNTVVPSTAQAVQVILRAIDAEPHGLLIDGVTLTTRSPIFLDDFEGNESGDSDPCRWSP
jgi:hypothetical protein